jgi:hypothetical protein
MDEETLTVWLDTALLMLGGFVLMTVLMLTAINPPAKAAKINGEQSPGNIIVEAHWPSEVDADVDLWVKAPGDHPVGYSNLAGKYFNLLRDDLGKDLDYEIAYSRGMPPGEYIVNVHLYRAGPTVALPLKVEVVASVKPKPQSRAQKVAAANVDLRREGEELTAFRFTLDGNGHLVPGSINSLYRALRSAAR